MRMRRRFGGLGIAWQKFCVCLSTFSVVEQLLTKSGLLEHGTDRPHQPSKGRPILHFDIKPDNSMVFSFPKLCLANGSTIVFISEVDEDHVGVGIFKVDLNFCPEAHLANPYLDRGPRDSKAPPSKANPQRFHQVCRVGKCPWKQGSCKCSSPSQSTLLTPNRNKYTKMCQTGKSAVL